MKMTIEVQLVEHEGKRKLSYRARCNDTGLREEVTAITRIADFVREESKTQDLPVLRNTQIVQSVGGAN